MSAWSLTDTQVSSTVTFDVAGEDGLGEDVVQPHNIQYPMESSDPIVTYGDAQTATPITPVWIVVGDYNWDLMRPMLTSGHLLNLEDDLGNVTPVRIHGYKVRRQFAPASAPRRSVTVSLVGVS